MRTKRLPAVLGVCVSILMVPAAHAQLPNSWTDGTGKWETSNNWSRLAAPSSSDSADLITNAGNNTVTIDAATVNNFPAAVTISNLIIRSNTLKLSSAGTGTPLHVFNTLSLSNNATAIVSNSIVQVDTGLEVGASGSTNLLLITSAGRLTSPATTIGGVPGDGNTVSVTGTNSLWTATGSLNIRNSSAGNAVVISSGATFAGSSIFLGNSATANGNIIIVTDPGSTWSNSGTLNIGGSSSGAQFVVSNGAKAVSSRVVIGQTGSNHTATVTGSNSLWLVTNTMQVGTGGPAHSLTIAGGGAVVVSNASHTAILTVNGATLSLNSGTFQADNLLVTNGASVQLSQPYQVENATFTVSGGFFQANSNFVVAVTANSTGVVAVSGGFFVATNGVVGIGNNGTLTNGLGVGQMIVSTGSFQAVTILLGSSAGGQGSMVLTNGGLIRSAGTNAVLVCNDFTQLGGDFVWSNGTVYCGLSHPGAYALSDGTSLCQDAFIGYDDAGSMTVAGGTMTISSHLIVGQLGGPMSTGAVWITGGQLTMANYSIIGSSGVGQMSISNGTVTAADVFVCQSSNPGTLTVAGGTLSLNNLVLANPGSQFNFSGGWLNAKGTTSSNGRTFIIGDGVGAATYQLQGGVHSFANGLEIRNNATLRGCGTINGTVIVDSGGSVVADCGTLTFNNDVTNSGIMHAENDGVLESYGHVVNNGVIDIMDGTTSFHSTFSGTGPVVNAAYLRIVSIARQTADVKLTWTTVGGRSYVVQTNAPPPTGNYVNNFTDFSPIVVMPGESLGTTNFLDIGGATNTPIRYYRVRLVP